MYQDLNAILYLLISKKLYFDENKYKNDIIVYDVSNGLIPKLIAK